MEEVRNMKNQLWHLTIIWVTYKRDTKTMEDRLLDFLISESAVHATN